MKNHTKAAHCPLCSHTFAYGILGWDSHLLASHPEFKPMLTEDLKKATFIKKYPQFFEQALTKRPSNRPPAN